MAITLDGTNGVTASSPATIKASAYLDAAGGNTATINGMVPAPATSPTLTTPIISGNLGAGGANYGTSGQVLTSGGSGASPSWSTISAGGMTLLGTLATTSGSSQTLSGLTLTSYKTIFAVYKGVSGSTDLTIKLTTVGGIAASTSATGINAIFGFFQTDLATGVVVHQSIGALGPGTTNNVNTAGTTYYGIQNTVTNASTSITFAADAGTFDAGSILIYGVK